MLSTTPRGNHRGSAHGQWQHRIEVDTIVGGCEETTKQTGRGGAALRQSKQKISIDTNGDWGRGVGEKKQSTPNPHTETNAGGGRNQVDELPKENAGSKPRGD